MSPRPTRLRKVSQPPLIAGMKPYGLQMERTEKEAVFLHFEEYEALRLCDHQGLNHLEAARQMEVSRPTLTRIYSIARQKVAQALVEGKQLILEGGKVYFDSDWYICKTCGCYFNHPEKQLTVSHCPLCSSSQVESYPSPPGMKDLQQKK
ncbi:MAG: DUF134 domain-containing protein [Bacteroidales bacterium]